MPPATIRVRFESLGPIGTFNVAGRDWRAQMQDSQGFLDCSGQLHLFALGLRLFSPLCLLLLALVPLPLLLRRLSLPLLLARKALTSLLPLPLKLLPVWLFKLIAQGLIILEQVTD